MHTSSYLVNDLVLIDELSASNEILLDLRLVGPVEKLAVLKMEAHRPTKQTESGMRYRSEMEQCDSGSCQKCICLKPTHRKQRNSRYTL